MAAEGLGEGFPVRRFLQATSSIQPRTSPVKFARSLGLLRARAPRASSARRLPKSDTGSKSNYEILATKEEMFQQEIIKKKTYRSNPLPKIEIHV